MRKHLWLAVAMLLVGVGCPLEFGIGGRIDKAMEKDMREMKGDLGVCPAGTHQRPLDKPCTDTSTDPSCKPECVADSD